eukprot:c30082_g1_i1 orf=1-558(-)
MFPDLYDAVVISEVVYVPPAMLNYTWVFLQKSRNLTEFEKNSTKEDMRIENWLSNPWLKVGPAAMAQGVARHVDDSYFGVNSGVSECKRVCSSDTREESNMVPCGSDGDMRTLCRVGRLREALHILDLMDQRGIQIYTDTYVFLLQGCISMNAMTEGKKVHSHLIKSGFKPNIFLGNTLINMYAKC